MAEYIYIYKYRTLDQGFLRNIIVQFTFSILIKFLFLLD